MRVRLVAAIIHLQLVKDDGETLTPLQVEPVTVVAADWPPDLDAYLADVERQVDAPANAELNGGR